MLRFLFSRICVQTGLKNKHYKVLEEMFSNGFAKCNKVIRIIYEPQRQNSQTYVLVLAVLSTSFVSLG